MLNFRIYIIKNGHTSQECGKGILIREFEIWISEIWVGFRMDLEWKKEFQLREIIRKAKNVEFLRLISEMSRYNRMKFVRIRLGYELGLSFVGVVHQI